MSARPITRVRALAGGGESARVELVRVGDRPFVMKTHRLRNIAAERMFHAALAARGLPHLAITDHPDLASNQILLEYIEGSPTIGRAMSLDAFARMGAAVRGLHAQRADACTQLDARGGEIPASWPDVLQDAIDQALDAGAQSDLPEAMLSRIAERLETLTSFTPHAFVLTHGDLHLNNALLRGDDVVLFDKAAGIWSAPPAFDLCLIFSEAFPGARYGVARAGDEERLRTFFAGYSAMDDADEHWIDHFVLLRSLRRYPSPFVPELRDVIEAALARVGG
jgi:Ser/Thr protein kinase RdoA (MazF antagonist)